MDECTPLPPLLATSSSRSCMHRDTESEEQGRTLVHVSAQLERFLWYKGVRQGVVKGLFRGREGVLGCV